MKAIWSYHLSTKIIVNTKKTTLDSTDIPLCSSTMITNSLVWFALSLLKIKLTKNFSSL